MDPSWDMADMETCESDGGSFSHGIPVRVNGGMARFGGLPLSP